MQKILVTGEQVYWFAYGSSAAEQVMKCLL